MAFSKRDNPGESPAAQTARTAGPEGQPCAAPAPMAGLPVTVYPAEALPVLSGANAGDPLPLPEQSINGDYYRLSDWARPLTLALSHSAATEAAERGIEAGGEPGGEPGEATPGAAPAGHVAEGSPIGRPGAPVHLRGGISLMAPDGDMVEVMVLECEGLGRLALPLSPLMAQCTYTQIGADARPGPIRLADAVAGAFAAGTRIAMADGRQLPVEALEPGMAVITRDHGAQPLRWKGMVRLRAEGSCAPVVIMPGTMGNPRPLVVSPHHRLFLYRRAARRLAGAPELLVQARHLVDERRILRRPGGWVRYFGLVFDRHEVIYAEGVPCESLMVCPATLTRLPEKLAAPLRAAFPGLHQRLHVGRDIGPEMVSQLRGRAAASRR